jgi:repressor LexA
MSDTPRFRKGPPDARGRLPLTPRQREVLDVVKLFVRDHGYPPSMRQLSDAFGWAGPAAARHHFLLIERKGWIVREPRSPRAIRLVDD